jgi:hypothetical protein
MRLPVFAPKTGRAAGCDVVQHANETRCNTGTAQVQATVVQVLRRYRHCTAQVIQVLYSVQRRYRCCTARQNLRIKYNRRCGYVAVLCRLAN